MAINMAVLIKPLGEILGEWDQQSMRCDDCPSIVSGPSLTRLAKLEELISEWLVCGGDVTL